MISGSGRGSGAAELNATRDRRSRSIVWRGSIFGCVVDLRSRLAGL